MIYLLYLILAIVIFCRYALAKERNQLSLEQKGQFLEITSSPKNYLLYAMLVGITVITLQFHIMPFQLLFLLFYVVLLVFRIIKGVVNYKRMKALNFPSSYLQSIENYSVIMYVTFVVFIIIMGISFYHSILKFYHL